MTNFRWNQGIYFFTVAILSWMLSYFLYFQQMSTQFNTMISSMQSSLIESVIADDWLSIRRQLLIAEQLGFSEIKILNESKKLTYDFQTKMNYSCPVELTYPLKINGINYAYLTSCFRPIKNLMSFFNSPFFLSIGIAQLITFFAFLIFYLSSYRHRVDSLIQALSNDNNISHDQLDSVGIKIINIFKNKKELFQQISQLKVETAAKDAVNLKSRQVAHDLKSPLSLLNVVIYKLKNDENIELSGLLESVSNRILGIIRDLPDQHTNQNKSNSQFNLLNLVNKFIHEKKLEYPDCQIEFSSSDFNDKSFLVRGDFSEVSRLLSNIFNNAYEATLQNPPFLLKKIAINTKINRDYISLCISDNGSGMPIEIQNKIFESGFTYGKDHLPNSGSGLGLSHAKSVIESLGGQINIKTQLNLGTDVSITLPSASLESQTPPPKFPY